MSYTLMGTLWHQIDRFVELLVFFYTHAYVLMLGFKHSGHFPNAVSQYVLDKLTRET